MGIPFSAHETIAKAANGLTRATASITDEFMRNQVLLAGNMLIDNVNAFIEKQTSRRYRDFVFALQDLRGMVEELGPESVAFSEPLANLETVVEQLEAYGLSGDLASKIDAFTEKLQEHVRASEKQAFLPPGTEAAPLPHPPQTLTEEATEIRAGIVAGEFESQALDRLVESPDQFELRDYTQLADELSAITQ